MHIFGRLLCVLVLSLSTAAVGQISYSFSFLTPSGNPNDVASADFNLDGKPDIVVATDFAVNVFLSTRKGVYGTSETYALPFNPEHIETPDINNDGYPDLVIASGDTNAQVMILLNNGNGTFRPGKNITLGAQFEGWVSAGDFNNDGNVDLVVRELLSKSSQFVIYLGHGDGTFTKGQTLSMSTYSSYPLIEDFNQDGKLDIVNVLGTKALIWPGNGDGTFGVPTSIKAPVSFFDLAAGDFNNDGIIDLAISYANVCGDACDGPNYNRVYIYKNNGKAVFTRVSSTDFAGCSGAYLIPADVDGDGKLDINVVGPDHYCGFSTVGLGNGSGGFSKQVYAPTGDITPTTFYRDMNLDSRHDIVYTDALGGTVTQGLATTGYTNCAPPSSAKIASKICSPTSSASSTYTLRASGNSPSGIKRLEVWIDGVKKYQKWSDQLAKSFTLSAGKHRISVVAVDRYKGTGQSAITVTVQ